MTRSIFLPVIWLVLPSVDHIDLLPGSQLVGSEITLCGVMTNSIQYMSVFWP